jgi:hypothetical protein
MWLYSAEPKVRSCTKDIVCWDGARPGCCQGLARAPWRLQPLDALPTWGHNGKVCKMATTVSPEMPNSAMRAATPPVNVSAVPTLSSGTANKCAKRRGVMALANFRKKYTTHPTHAPLPRSSGVVLSREARHSKVACSELVNSPSGQHTHYKGETTASWHRV